MDTNDSFDSLLEGRGKLSSASFGEINPITEAIIGCAYTVSNTLGCGFLEKVYENALAHELRKTGYFVQQQYGISVIYDGETVGIFDADIVVNELVIVELKTVKTLTDIHMAQCMNYLRATGARVCLLINFGNPKVEVKRIILD